jgi:hypothetical protein
MFKVSSINLKPWFVPKRCSKNQKIIVVQMSVTVISNRKCREKCVLFAPIITENARNWLHQIKNI